MFFNRITAFACCIIISVCTFSQSKEPKVTFGDVKPDDFKPQVYSIDSSADAIYLDDIGSSKHEGNNSGDFSVVFKVHERIRLLHKKSFDDLATIKIPLSKLGTEMERIDDLQAATYNLEDVKVVATKVDKNSIFKDKDGDDQVVKFTFPNLKEGCIIEYSYTKIIPFFALIPQWTFQGHYPELWSEFTVEVPEFFDFVVMKDGYLDAEIDTAIRSADNFNILDPGGVNASQTYSFRSNTIKHTWAYKNVPAIKEENFITDLSNYTQSIEFQLSAIRYPNQEPKFFMHTWPETIDQLMKDEDFGQDLSKENGWLKDDIKDVAKGESDPLNKARKIYEYVRNNYTCLDHSAIYLSQSLKKTEQSKKGNVVDINMLLIAMLKTAGYNADPVLLSTRGHGKTYDIYPILNKFNYLIARVNINDSKYYLLDASDPVLGFGHLNEDCYNGNARVISSFPELIDLSADSLHEAEVISLFLSNDSTGSIAGTYKHVMGEMQSEDMREKMKKTTADDYFKNVKKSFSFDVTLANTTIDSLAQPEMPVSVQYDFSFKPQDDIVYFTPILADWAYKDNPFSATQRFYPVEMPYCMDETYILNMEIPAGYKVDELPKSTRVSLNESEGMFEYLIQQSEDHIQLRCIVSSADMDKNSVFTEQADDNHILKKFALPAIEEGCIIEYSYTITSPYDFNMPSWKFQRTEYPVLWSQYEVSIPSTLTYALSKQGTDSFYVNKSWEGKENYKVSKTNIQNSFQSTDDLIVAANTLNYRWIEKDIAPLKTESYVSTMDNYIDKIEFQLASTYNGEDKSDVINTWKTATDFFLGRNDFKEANSKENLWIKDVPEQGNSTDDLETAKSIYYYIQNNFTCTDENNIFKKTSLYDVYKLRQGTIRGINLLLMAMLNNKNIYTQPVILSTKENGFLNPAYPVVDKFNYLVCRAIINGKAYLLDATKPALGFGKLSENCYNGYARILSDDPSNDYLYLFADSLNESNVTTVSLSNTDNGEITGSYKNIMGDIQSLKLRQEMQSVGEDEYFKKIKNNYEFDVDISNAKIDSLEQKEMPVSLEYNLNFRMNGDIVYFNPLSHTDAETENPFKAATRSFPIEIPYCLNKTYVLNMQVPVGYKVEELPKSARVSLNDNEGTFQYLIQQTDDHIQLLCRLKLNKATFDPQDYETLRKFFAFIVEKESEQIVFKKQ